MFELKVESDFAASHNLRGYDGPCERIHGHNWKVVTYITAEKLDKIGIAIDFKTVKAELNKLIDVLDHRNLNDIEPFDKINPTAENLAKYFYFELGSVLNDGNIKVNKIEIWETERASASYFE